MIFFTFFAYDIVKFHSLSFFSCAQMKINDYYFGSFARESPASCAAVPGADLYLIPLFFSPSLCIFPPGGVSSSSAKINRKYLRSILSDRPRRWQRPLALMTLIKCVFKSAAELWLFMTASAVPHRGVHPRKMSYLDNGAHRYTRADSFIQLFKGWARNNLQ